MYNKKGFTLVELLVTIVILGIITALAFPILNRITEYNQNRQFKLYADYLLSVGKLYTNSYEEDFITGVSNRITCFDLERRKMFKDIDYKGITCNNIHTKINVYKVNDHFEYSVNLYCAPKGETYGNWSLYPYQYFFDYR